MSGFLCDEYPAGATIYALLHSYDSNGASITLTGLAVTDVEIFKNGSTTQRASDAGYALLDTDGIDFDSITGIHGISIDLNDNTDSGFYAAGSQYTVVLSSVTIDTRTVNLVLGSFRIRAAEASAGVPAVGVSSIAAGAITATAVATGAIDADALATDAVAEIADGVWDEACSGHVASGSFGQALNIVRAGTAQAGASTTITLDASASATDDFYNSDLIVITGGTGAGQARFVADYVGATKVATVSAWVTNPSSDSVFVILPFGAIPGATAPTAAEIADAVWDEDATGHQTQGTFGQAIGDPGADSDTIWALANTNLNATVSSRASQTSLDTVDGFLDTEIADIQARLPAALVSGRIDASVGAVANNAITAASIASDAITAAKIAANAITAAKIAADAIGASQLAADAVTEIQSGLATAAALATVDDFLDTEIADIQARLPAALVSGRIDASVGAAAANTITASALAADAVTEIQSGLATAAALDTVDNFLDTEIAAIITAIDALPTNAELATALGTADDAVLAAIAALNNLSAAQVNAEVVDALATDTYAEPTGVPAATASLAVKLGTVYMALRNRVDVTGTKKTYYDDGGAAEFEKDLSDDGTTYSESEANAI